MPGSKSEAKRSSASQVSVSTTSRGSESTSRRFYPDSYSHFGPSRGTPLSIAERYSGFRMFLPRTIYDHVQRVAAHKRKSFTRSSVDHGFDPMR